jgi:hypothetical protein
MLHATIHKHIEHKKLRALSSKMAGSQDQSQWSQISKNTLIKKKQIELLDFLQDFNLNLYKLLNPCNQESKHNDLL